MESVTTLGPYAVVNFTLDSPGVLNTALFKLISHFLQLLHKMLFVLRNDQLKIS